MTATAVQNLSPSAPQTREVSANGLTFCVEERGSPRGEPLLLIMGLGAQLTLWPEPLLEDLVACGFRVIRFDNRDIGLSSDVGARLNGHPLLAMARYKVGVGVPAPYTLYDCADDVAALMDALEIPRAHLMGASMGGMISQIVAARFPERVNSVTLVMTSTNSPRLPMPDPRVIWALQGSGIKGHDEASVIRRGQVLWGLIQSSRYPKTPQEIADRIRRDYRRSYRPAGIMRQMRGVLATGDISPLSRCIRCPVQIVHGAEDRLIRPAAGEQLAHLIPESRLTLLDAMGHDLPEPLLGEFTGLVGDLAGRT